jgi:hypothetical protein
MPSYVYGSDISFTASGIPLLLSIGLDVSFDAGGLPLLLAVGIDKDFLTLYRNLDIAYSLSRRRL